MKKIFILLLISFLGSNVSGQVFNSGASYASVGYGLGYGFAGSITTVGSSVSNLGPICLNYEYAINDNIGVGVNISYSSTRYNYGSSYDKYTRLGILARGAYHFDLFSELDVYSGIGVGFLRYNYTNDYSDVYNYNFGSPLGYQVFAGARYFFSDAIGAYAEVGYGISVINAGIVFGL